ncbi:MAG: hypothetical protein FWD49_07960 [Firmicutes bacterium]|nr:hypothetical protein [Bacillota bacterium]
MKSKNAGKIGEDTLKSGFSTFHISEDMWNQGFNIDYSSFKEDNEVPLWWLKEAPVPLSKKDAKSAVKAQGEIILKTKGRIVATENRTKSVLENIQRADEVFSKRLSDSEELFILKIKDMDLVAEENASQLRYDLAIKEEQLKDAEREKRESEMHLRHEEATKQRQIELMEEFEAIQEKIAKASVEIEEATEISQQNTIRAVELKAENAQRAEENPELLRETVFTPERERRSFMPVAKRYEAFSEQNIVDFRDIHFKKKTERIFIFKGFNLQIKAEGITVAVSENKLKLALIKQMLFRSYGSDMQMTCGAIRISGTETGTVSKDDYKEVFGKHLISFADTYGLIRKNGGSVKKIVGKDEVHEFNAYASVFGLSKPMFSGKVSALTDEQLSALALSVLLSSSHSLKVLEEEYLSKSLLNSLILRLNHSPLKSALLILTSLPEIVTDLNEARVHTV